MASNDKDKADDNQGDLFNQVPGYAPFGQQAQEPSSPQNANASSDRGDNSAANLAAPGSIPAELQSTIQEEPQWPQWPQSAGQHNSAQPDSAQPSAQPGGEQTGASADGQVLEWKASPHEWLGGRPDQAPAWPGAENYGQPAAQNYQGQIQSPQNGSPQIQSQQIQPQQIQPQQMPAPPAQMTQQQFEQYQQLQQNYLQQQYQQQQYQQQQSGDVVWPGQAQPVPGPGNAQGNAQGTAQGPVQGQTPGQFPGQFPGQAPGQYPGQVPGQFPGQIPGQNPGQVPMPGQGGPGMEGPEFIPSTPKYMNPPAYPDLPWKAGPGPTWAIFADHEHHRMPPAPPQPKPVLPPGGSANNPLPVLPLPIGNPEPPEEDLESLSAAARLAKLAGSAAKTLTSQNNPTVQNPNGERQAKNTGSQSQEARGFRRPLGPGAFPGQDESEDEMASSFISKRPFLSSGGRGNSKLGFSKSDIFGLATYNFMVTKDILFDPRVFFCELSLSGGFGEPILYSFFACLLSSALYAVAKLNLLLFFWAFIVSFLSVILGAVVVTWAFRKMGGKGNLEGTFRVLAFSKATVVFSWISLGAVPLGMLLAAAYTGYMNYVGLTRVHHLPRKNTIILVVVLSILGMLWRQGMP